MGELNRVMRDERTQNTALRAELQHAQLVQDELQEKKLEIERLRSRLLAHQIDPDAGEPARRRDPWAAWGQAGRGPSPSPPPPSSPSHSPLGWRPEVWGVQTSPRQIDGSWVPKFSASKVGRAQRPSGSP